MENIKLGIMAMTPGLGSVKLRRLMDCFGSAERIIRTDANELSASGCADVALCERLHKTIDEYDIDTVSMQWARQGIKVVSIWDEDYPQLLANTYNPPAVLFYRGNLPQTQRLIAIVGPRRASAYGRNICHMLTTELVMADVGIVSGAARGIDSCAHKGALEKQGYTIAVLACGVDVAYPPENAKLLSEVAATGAVISEYPPGTLPLPGQFPARNRIISGLSRGVLVVEAPEKSGSLITADFALEEGRDVFAVPGSILSDSSKGTHRLIKQGAKLVDCGADILQEYDWNKPAMGGMVVDIDSTEQKIIDLLSYEEPLLLDELAGKTDISISGLTYTMLELTLKGLVEDCGGQRYIRVAGGGRE